MSWLQYLRDLEHEQKRKWFMGLSLAGIVLAGYLSLFIFQALIYPTQVTAPTDKVEIGAWGVIKSGAAMVYQNIFGR